MTKNILIIILQLACILKTTATYADELSISKETCTDVKISIEKLGPVRDQGIAGLCFTYEGADLVTYKTGVRVSAIDLAISYFRSQRVKKITTVYKSGGETNASLESALKIGGICSEEEMPSNETFLDPDETNPRIFGAFKWLENNSWQKPETLSVLAEIFPYIDAALLKQANRNNSFKDRMIYLQKKACRERQDFSQFKLKYFDAENPKQVLGLLKIVDKQLENDNVIGMGFRANDLFSEKLKEADDDDNHATTLVGRRWNEAKNSCEYLMRDNFGAQCSIYKNHFDCDGGYIWLDEKFMTKNLYEIEYFE